MRIDRGGARVLGLRRPPTTLVLSPFVQAPGQPAREESAAESPRTACAPRSPRPPGSLPDAPRPSAVRSQPAGLRLGRSARSDAAPGAHPERRGGAAASKKQTKKKSRNGASVANGGGQVSEEPVSEEAPVSAEAQARAASPVRPARARRPGRGPQGGGGGAGGRGVLLPRHGRVPTYRRRSSWPGSWRGAWTSWSWASRCRDRARGRVRAFPWSWGREPWSCGSRGRAAAGAAAGPREVRVDVPGHLWF